MGCVVVSPVDTNVLYAGTGEPNYAQAYGWGGYGVFKSTDGGAHWAPSNTGMGYNVVTDLLINPTDPTRLLACCSNGIFLSTNSGASWALKVASGSYMHQVMQRGTSDTIFAISESKLYVSTNWGNTWVTRNLDPVTSPRYGNGRMAIAPSDDNVIYASWLIDSTWGNQCFAEVFRSGDGGVTFTKVYSRNSLPTLASYDGTVGGGGFGWANYCITVSPTNPNTVFTGAHLVFMSTDGGNSFNAVIPDWWCCMHTDIHQLAFDPGNTNNIFACTDGGIFLSNDLGVDWQPSSNGLDCSQYFSFGQGNVDSTFVIGGTQDNAIIYLNSDGNLHTYDGGDYSEFILCDYFNPHNAYTSNTTGFVFDPYNRANSAVLNLPTEIQSVTEPCMVFSPLNAGTAYAFKTNVYGTTNLDQYTMDASGGTSNITWTQLTNLTNQNVMALAMSPVNDTLIYFITDSNLLYTCTVSGGALQAVSSQLLPSVATVAASIAVSTLNPNVIYITCNNKLYRSANAGANWTDLTGNLPGINFQSVFIDPYSTIEGVYLVTDLGVYYTGWTVPGWVDLNAGFPDSLQNAHATFYQPVAGAGLFKGSNSATSHIGMGTWGAGFQEASFYSQKCDALTNNWQLKSFGAPPVSTACFDNTYTAQGGSGSITINTNGQDMTYINDQFTMVAGEFVHDGSITCSVLSVAQGDPTIARCEAGLMMRSVSTGIRPAFIMIGVDGNGHAIIISRTVGGDVGQIGDEGIQVVPYPDSLRLTKVGDTVTVYGNFGTGWINYGPVPINLGDTILAGVAAAASGSNAVVNHAAFSVPTTTGFAQLNTGVETIATNTVSLYPDPAHNSITLELLDKVSFSYEVTDITGRRVLTGISAATGGQKIDVSGLSPGNYFISLTDAQKNIVGKSRFVKD